jgi:hypothetical protein
LRVTDYFNAKNIISEHAFAEKCFIAGFAVNVLTDDP